MCGLLEHHEIIRVNHNFSFPDFQRHPHLLSSSRFLHRDNQDHMGEVLQKDLRDRQPKISVAHDQARL